MDNVLACIELDAAITPDDETRQWERLLAGTATTKQTSPCEESFSVSTNVLTSNISLFKHLYI